MRMDVQIANLHGLNAIPVTEGKSLHPCIPLIASTDHALKERNGPVSRPEGTARVPDPFAAATCSQCLRSFCETMTNLVASRGEDIQENPLAWVKSASRAWQNYLASIGCSTAAAGFVRPAFCESSAFTTRSASLPTPIMVADDIA